MRRDLRLKPDSAKSKALLSGSLTYYGKPCKNGHNGLRYTNGSNCVECIGTNIVGIAIIRRDRSPENIKLAEEAIANNSTTYVPTNACKHGHRLRFVGSNNCVTCSQETLERQKELRRFGRIEKEYGLNKEQYLQMVSDQSSCCKICNTYKENSFSLHIDHCHETNKVRGLLCNKCNQAIGLLKHDIDLLHKASAYLQEN